jgi:hypothetical protein
VRPRARPLLRAGGGPGFHKPYLKGLKHLNLPGATRMNNSEFFPGLPTACLCGNALHVPSGISGQANFRSRLVKGSFKRLFLIAVTIEVYVLCIFISNDSVNNRLSRQRQPRLRRVRGAVYPEHACGPPALGAADTGTIDWRDHRGSAITRASPTSYPSMPRT